MTVTSFFLFLPPLFLTLRKHEEDMKKVLIAGTFVLALVLIAKFFFISAVEELPDPKVGDSELDRALETEGAFLLSDPEKYDAEQDDSYIDTSIKVQEGQILLGDRQGPYDLSDINISTTDL